MSKYVLSLDVGKWNTQLLGRSMDVKENEGKKVIFRTKIYDLKNGNVELDTSGENHLITYEGNEYIVGDQGEQKSYGTTKTNIIHKLCAYTAICELIEPDTEDNEIYLFLACPLSVFKVDKLKEEFKDYIKGDGPINIKVDGKNYTFEIKEVEVRSESTGVIHVEPKSFIDKTVGVCDLGGTNFTFGLYINGVCKKSNRFIEELGTEKLIEYVREQMSIYKGGNLIDNDTAEKVLKDGGLMHRGEIDKKSIAYLDKAKELYLNNILGAIKDHRFNIDEWDNIIFIGGTTYHIESLINTTLGHACIPNEPNWATVKGNYKLAFNKFCKK